MDYIEWLIDRQLASIPIDSCFVYKGRVGQVVSSRSVGSNFIEDMFITALDKKYNKTHRLQDTVVNMLCQGYKVDEISCLMGLSPSTVRRYIYQDRNKLMEDIICANYPY
jgi:DNA-binding NarL/FixJ family response regulator